MQQKRYFSHVVVAGLVLALGFFTISSIKYTPKVVEYSEVLKRGAIRWLVDQSGLRYPDPRKATIALDEAIRKFVYKYPESFFKEFLSTPHVFQEENINKDLKAAFDKVSESTEYVYVDGWAYISAKNIDKQTTLVVLKSQEHTLAASTGTFRRPDVAAVFHSSSLKNSGFGALISKKTIQPGMYEVGVYVESYGDRGISFSGKYVEIKK